MTFQNSDDVSEPQRRFRTPTTFQNPDDVSEPRRRFRTPTTFQNPDDVSEPRRRLLRPEVRAAPLRRMPASRRLRPHLLHDGTLRRGRPPRVAGTARQGAPLTRRRGDGRSSGGSVTIFENNFPNFINGLSPSPLDIPKTNRKW